MRKLIIANTYYQIIFSFQMRNTLFKRDDVTLIISDHSRNADIIASRIKKLNFFSNVVFTNTLGAGETRNTKDKLVDFFKITFSNTNRYIYLVDKLIDKTFDEIIVFNYTIETYGLHAYLSEYNEKIKVSRYEEGILSYNTVKMDTGRRKLINSIRKAQGKAAIEDSLYNFYCFYPRLYQGNLNPVEVPTIEKDSEVIDYLKKAFSVEDESLDYEEKYIFFSSVYDFEGGKPIGEFELVKKIADAVGKKNVVVKVHPRDVRMVYQDYGLRVDKNSSIPWEVILLCGKFDGKVLLTVNSTSVLSSCLLSDDNVRGCYLYKLCDISENEAAKYNAVTISALLEDEILKDKLSKISIPNNIDEIVVD